MLIKYKRAVKLNQPLLCVFTGTTVFVKSKRWVVHCRKSQFPRMWSAGTRTLELGDAVRMFCSPKAGQEQFPQKLVASKH